MFLPYICTYAEKKTWQWREILKNRDMELEMREHRLRDIHPPFRSQKKWSDWSSCRGLWCLLATSEGQKLQNPPASKREKDNRNMSWQMHQFCPCTSLLHLIALRCIRELSAEVHSAILYHSSLCNSEYPSWKTANKNTWGKCSIHSETTSKS